MKIQHQWFDSGERVTRVSYPEEIGLPTTGYRPPEADFGKILCVDVCDHTEKGIPIVHFIGVPDPWRCGFWTCCFRRIEEIQLCVRAAEKFKQNEEVEV